MSRQVNFFTDPADAERLHSWLLGEFPGLRVIPTDRGLKHELEPLPAEGALSGRETMLLVPAWARNDIVLRPLLDEEGFVVSETASPVIEYTPCVLDPESNCLRVGRLYWTFDRELQPDEQRQLDRMFRWVRSHSIPDPVDKRFRIFEQAARNARTLDYGFNIKAPSPPWPK